MREVGKQILDCAGAGLETLICNLVVAAGENEGVNEEKWRVERAAKKGWLFRRNLCQLMDDKVLEDSFLG